MAKQLTRNADEAGNQDGQNADDLHVATWSQGDGDKGRLWVVTGCLCGSRSSGAAVRGVSVRGGVVCAGRVS